MYTPTPGIPTRSDTIPDLMDCYFRSPATMPHNILISLREGEQPLEKRGSLCAISPEEVRHAMMAAIARDIEGGIETEVLEEWRRKVLNCTAIFQVHASEAGRLQVAMQLRENMANDHEAMSRTQLQRIYEIIFFPGHVCKDPRAGPSHCRKHSHRVRESADGQGSRTN